MVGFEKRIFLHVHSAQQQLPPQHTCRRSPSGICMRGSASPLRHSSGAALVACTHIIAEERCWMWRKWRLKHLRRQRNQLCNKPYPLILSGWRTVGCWLVCNPYNGIRHYCGAGGRTRKRARGGAVSDTVEKIRIVWGDTRR